MKIDTIYVYDSAIKRLKHDFTTNTFAHRRFSPCATNARSAASSMHAWNSPLNERKAKLQIKSWSQTLYTYKY